MLGINIAYIYPHTLQQGNFHQKFNSCELKEDGILMYKGETYVPSSNDIKNLVLREIHNVPYIEHP
jgi:hypothetical protein